MIITITSHTDKSPREIAKIVFKHLDSVSGLIRVETDLSRCRDIDMFVITACEGKEEQVKELIQQLERELNFSAKLK